MNKARYYEARVEIEIDEPGKLGNRERLTLVIEGMEESETLAEAAQAVANRVPSAVERRLAGKAK